MTAKGTSSSRTSASEGCGSRSCWETLQESNTHWNTLRTRYQEQGSTDCNCIYCIISLKLQAKEKAMESHDVKTVPTLMQPYEIVYFSKAPNTLQRSNSSQSRRSVVSCGRRIICPLIPK